MQTERVTFLTSEEHKAALDAFAASNGMSVGHVVREATARYMTSPSSAEEDRALDLLLAALDEALPEMQASLDRSIERLSTTRHEIDAMLREAGLRE